MKKIGLILAVLTVPPSQVLAQGVVANNGGLASGIEASAVNAIPLAQKGAADGVPTLNASKQITAPSVSGGDRIGAWQSTVSNIDRYSTGFEADVMGGVEPFVKGGSLGGKTKSLYVITDPYGPYSPGCGLGVAMMGIQSWTPQFPVSQSNPALGAPAVVGVGGYDAIANCTLTGNFPARLILPVDHYTPNSVVLTRGLTAEEAAMVQWNMYITTNSPDAALTAPATGSGNLPAKNLYAGFVIKPPAAGDKVIDVWAWAVPGIGNGAPGQAPQTSKLDTLWSAYTKPVVFLGGGAGDHSFAHNWFFHINKDDLTPTANTKSLIHTVTPLEIDLSLYSPTGNPAPPPDHSLKYGGITFNAGEYPNALTQDSFEIMFGGVMHNHIIFDGGPSDWNIAGDNFWLPAGALQGLNSNRQQLSAEWDQPVGNASTVRTALWYEAGNGGVDSGWKQAVVHLGVLYRDKAAPQEPPQSGDITATPSPSTKLGDVEFDQGGNFGAVSLCGYGTNCGLRVNGDGTTYINAATANSVSISAGLIGDSAVFKNKNTHKAAELTLTNAADTTGATYGNLFLGSLSAAGGVSATGGVVSGNDMKIRSKHSLVFSQDGTDTYPAPTLSWISQTAMLFSVPAIANTYVDLELGGVTSHGSISTTGTLSTSGSFKINGGKTAWFLTPDQTSDSNVTGLYACSHDVLCVTSVSEQTSSVATQKALRVPGAVESRGGAYNNRNNYSSLIGDGAGNWSVPKLTVKSGAKTTVQGGAIAEAAYTLATLPKGTIDGQHLWCSDCKLNGETGVLIVWHATSAKWTDALNNTLKH